MPDASVPVPQAQPQPQPQPAWYGAPAPAPAPQPVRPDAILCPVDYPKLKPDEDKHVKYKEEFGPILGSKVVYARFVEPSHRFWMITGTPNDAKGRGISRYFSPSHPSHAGQDRYTWADRGDGVMYGTLTAEAKEDEQP